MLHAPADATRCIPFPTPSELTGPRQAGGYYRALRKCRSKAGQREGAGVLKPTHQVRGSVGNRPAGYAADGSEGASLTRDEEPSTRSSV